MCNTESSNRLKAAMSARRATLVKTAAVILRDDAEAEDVVQDTFTAIWKNRKRYAIKKVEAYLFTAVRVNAIKRRSRRVRMLPLDDDRDYTIAEGENEWDSIDPLELEEALYGLPTMQAAVIRMKYYMGLTFREIGENLLISTDTAASRARYALDKLRRSLKSRKEDKGRRKR